MATIYQCDRCRSEVDKLEELDVYGIISYEICEDCVDALKLWLGVEPVPMEVPSESDK